MVHAYYIDTKEEVTKEQLQKIGVLQWQLNADTYEEDGKLAQVRKERDYKNHDVVNISKASLGDAYDAKLKMFFEEHLHEDEEIRFILDGSGFFDVRDAADKWIRIEVFKNDLLVLPAGIYHRFSLDDKAYIKAMRLFKDDPKWTPLDRVLPNTDSVPSRKDYLLSVQTSA
jgi:1,2-dihydroxy-3-keto-5-methylthiopentene dioxygenase